MHLLKKQDHLSCGILFFPDFANLLISFNMALCPLYFLKTDSWIQRLDYFGVGRGVGKIIGSKCLILSLGGVPAIIDQCPDQPVFKR